MYVKVRYHKITTRKVLLHALLRRSAWIEFHPMYTVRSISVPSSRGATPLTGGRQPDRGDQQDPLRTRRAGWQRR